MFFWILNVGHFFGTESDITVRLGSLLYKAFSKTIEIHPQAIELDVSYFKIPEFNPQLFVHFRSGLVLTTYL